MREHEWSGTWSFMQMGHMKPSLTCAFDLTKISATCRCGGRGRATTSVRGWAASRPRTSSAESDTVDVEGPAEIPSHRCSFTAYIHHVGSKTHAENFTHDSQDATKYMHAQIGQNTAGAVDISTGGDVGILRCRQAHSSECDEKRSLF